MIYLYLFGTCFHFIYVFMIIAKEKQISCRYLLVNPYKIIYYVDEKEETIFIVTLFHTHQHPSKLNREVGL